MTLRGGGGIDCGGGAMRAPYAATRPSWRFAAAANASCVGAPVCVAA